MSDIIFEDALEQWQQLSETSIGSFLQILHNEIDNNEQFQRYLTRIDKIVIEIRSHEDPNS